MWRYDAARSAASPDGIADQPVLLWSRALPPVRQAWPRELLQRLDFDASYEPVVMGKRLFLGSPNDGSITAYDTDTGAEQWKVFTEGPVRCAPACWNGRVYAGSDDGCLYCLDAQTGALVWKVRGAPADRPDRRQLGNGHLVSFWPVRGGPVIANGTVYFGAGIWPIFGVFLHAVDAVTGQAKWTNGELNYIANVRGQAAFKLDTGLSPQGHLGLIKGNLMVPCGRSLPAGLDAATGKLIYYDQGTRRGHSRVVMHGDYAFIGKDGVLNVDTFIEIGTLGQAGYAPYKMVAGCDAWSAFEGGVAYGLAGGIFYAYDVAGARIVDRETEYGTQIVRTKKWEPTVRWQFATPDAGQKSGTTIKAGKHLYGSVGRKVLALEGLGGPPRILWERALEGTPSSLAAADDKLFVVTAEGGLYCLGAGAKGHAIVTAPAPLAPVDDAWTAKAREIVSVSGVNAGYALVLGLIDGRLVDELLKQTEMRVIAADSDAQKVETLRRRYAAAGLLGTRVELFVAKPFDILFPPYLASLMLSENPAAAGFPMNLDGGRLFDGLRPYGGTLCLELPADRRQPFETWANAAGPAGAKVTQAGCWSLWTREGALPGSAPWSHQGGDAANTFCSQDDRVRGPLGFLWYDDLPAPPGSGAFAMKAQVSGGCVYVHGPGKGGFAQCSYDAYTGLVLWTNVVRTATQSAVAVAASDGIYFAADGKCLVFGLRDGKVIKTFTFTVPERALITGLRVGDEVVVVLIQNGAGSGGLSLGGGGYSDVAGHTLVCLDRQTGRELWRREAREQFHDGALALGAGSVYGVDSIPTGLAEKNVAKPEDLKSVESTVFALDQRSGAERWSRRVVYDSTRTWTPAEWAQGLADQHVAKRHASDWLSYDAKSGRVVAGRFLLGSAWEAKTGAPCWSLKEIRCSAPVIVRDNTLVGSSGNVYDLLTGERVGNYAAVRQPSCNYAIGSRHLITIRRGNAAYYDVEQEQGYQLRNIRSGCLNNMLAADGLMNVPAFDNHCVCNFPIQTSFAMVHMPAVADWSGATPLVLTLPPKALPPDARSRPLLDPAALTFQAVDLAAVANRALRDDLADDGKGGWTDQGPEADLRSLATGRQLYQGVPFAILEEPNSVVALRSVHLPQSPDLPERVTLAVGRRADAVYFLHDVSWAKEGVELFRYVIRYDDGPAVELPIVGGLHIWDWTQGLEARFPRAFKGLRPSVATTLRGERFPHLNVYLLEWVNPHPDKSIATIDFVAAGRGVPVLMGITTGQKTR
jgi:outer membrane protein assembly factor BamB